VLFNHVNGKCQFNMKGNVMLRKKEFVIVLLVGVLCLGTAFCQERTEKQMDPYENTSVLVEAFVVRVSTEALTEVGVNPIGQSPEGISILKILSCLNDPEKAEVLSGAKVQSSHSREAKSEQRKRVYVKNESSNVVKGKDGPREVKSVRYNDYSVGRTLSIQPFMISDDKIRIEFNYEESNYELADDDSAPPTIFDYEWSGRIVAKSGIPAIAGAVQDDESITFLILTATIQDSE
jgi:hypothetical protein